MRSECHSSCVYFLVWGNACTLAFKAVIEFVTLSSQLCRNGWYRINHINKCQVYTQIGLWAYLFHLVIIITPVHSKETMNFYFYLQLQAPHNVLLAMFTMVFFHLKEESKVVQQIPVGMKRPCSWDGLWSDNRASLTYTLWEHLWNNHLCSSVSCYLLTCGRAPGVSTNINIREASSSQWNETHSASDGLLRGLYVFLWSPEVLTYQKSTGLKKFPFHVAFLANPPPL